MTPLDWLARAAAAGLVMATPDGGRSCACDRRGRWAFPGIPGRLCTRHAAPIARRLLQPGSSRTEAR
jgi:hypothetical protein